MERREEEGERGEASFRTTDSWSPFRCPKRRNNFLSALNSCVLVLSPCLEPPPRPPKRYGACLCSHYQNSPWCFVVYKLLMSEFPHTCNSFLSHKQIPLCVFPTRPTPPPKPHSPIKTGVWCLGACVRVLLCMGGCKTCVGYRRDTSTFSLSTVSSFPTVSSLTIVVGCVIETTRSPLLLSGTNART